jgi:nucleoside permease NupC
VQVQWRPVVWGVLFQFVLALVTLRWSYGQAAFSFIAEQVNTFIAYTDVGSAFVYGTIRVHVSTRVFPVQARLSPARHTVCTVVKFFHQCSPSVLSRR